MRRQQRADDLLARTCFDYRTNRGGVFEFKTENVTTSVLEGIKQQFADNLSHAALPTSVFSESETENLVLALAWLTARELTVFHLSSGTPILAPHSAELVNHPDKFKARTRMALCGIDACGMSVNLEDYVGYLCDDWWEPADGEREVRWGLGTLLVKHVMSGFLR
jgi:hypothetical protein